MYAMRAFEFQCVRHMICISVCCCLDEILGNSMKSMLIEPNMKTNEIKTSTTTTTADGAVARAAAHDSFDVVHYENREQKANEWQY